MVIIMDMASGERDVRDPAPNLAEGSAGRPESVSEFGDLPLRLALREDPVLASGRRGMFPAWF